MSTTTATIWVVRCDDYTTRCSTKETAERKRQLIEDAGHCPLEHHIEEVPVAGAILGGQHSWRHLRGSR